MSSTINCPLNPKVRSSLPSPLQLHWPREGLNSNEQALLLDFIKLAYPYSLHNPQPAITFQKRKIHLLENSAWYLPVTVTFLMDSNGIKGIILLLNKARGEVLNGGNQRKPKTAHDLLGKKVVKKTATHNEVEVLEYLMHHPSRGLVPILGMRVTLDSKNRLEKHQYFEEYAQGALGRWIGNPLLSRPLFKLYLINGILKGLHQLHQLRPASAIERECFFTSFHGDIKPANVLLSEEGIKLTDFGASNLRHKLCFSPVYAHPYFLELRHKSEKEWIATLEKHGAKLDLWSVGILCGIILCNRFSNKKKGELPPFKFIEAYFPLLNHYENLTQKEVDQEIEYRRKRISDKATAPLMDALWNIIHGFLQIDLNQTNTLDQALALTNDLLQTFSPNLKRALDQEDRLHSLYQRSLPPPLRQRNDRKLVANVILQ